MVSEHPINRFDGTALAHFPFPRGNCSFILFAVEALTTEEICRAVQLALAEDIGAGDVTTLATVPESATANAVLRAREPLVVAGLALAEASFREISPGLQ